MSDDDLENALRAALRPVDPGDRLTRQVMSRLAEEPAGVPRPWSRAWSRPTWLALAASVLLALAGAHLWQVHRYQQGLEARLQLLEALRITGRKLDVAYRAVNDSQMRPVSGRALPSKTSGA
jgi:hypothetical protein